jgi:hypothetical protein
MISRDRSSRISVNISGLANLGDASPPSVLFLEVDLSD